MSDVPSGDGAAPEPVFRLIYRSQSVIAASDRSTELAAIFNSARRNNRGSGITGALMVTADAFVQALEGEESAVRDLYGTIRTDGRHYQVTQIDETTAPRTFGRWAMAEISTTGGADIRLVSNPRYGEIVEAGRDPSITPAQEEVLAFMRESVTGAVS